MSLNAYLDLAGTPSLISYTGNKLVIGTQGPQDIEFVRNGVVAARISSAGLVAQFDLANNSWFQSRNAANTADLDLLRANLSDNTELNVNQVNGQIRLTQGVSTVIALFQQVTGNTHLFRFYSPDTTRGITTGATNAGNPYFGTETNHALQLMTNNVTRLTLAADGTTLTGSTSNFTFAASDGTRDVRLGSLGGNPIVGTFSNSPFSLFTNNSVRLTLAAAGDTLLASQDLLIGQNTSDGADSRFLSLAGGAGATSTRGGYVQVYGNEQASNAGRVIIVGGNVATGSLDFYTTNSSADIRLYTASSLRWSVLGANGQLSQDATNGGDVLLTRASTSVRQPTVTGITAAGTTSGTATALTGVINNVTTTALNTGVRLWAAGIGSVIHVKNRGANALLVYPNTGGTIDGGAVDAGVSIAVGAIGTFMLVDTNTWVSSESGAA